MSDIPQIIKSKPSRWVVKPGERRQSMKYEAKYWLNEFQYIAVLDKAMVVVTVDKEGKPIKWVIFDGKSKAI